MSLPPHLPDNMLLGRKVRADNSFAPALRDGARRYQCLDPGSPGGFPYNPALLCPIPRSLNRNTLDIRVPFHGYDLWHLFELSYLEPSGLPRVCTGELIIPWDSPCLIESKSLKLYLNSFNMTVLRDRGVFQETIKRDLSRALGKEVIVRLYPISSVPVSEMTVKFPEGTVLEDEISARGEDPEPLTSWEVNPDLIRQSPDGETVTETLVSHLLRSNCLVTGQPDWGTVIIAYTGKKLDHEGLLRYIVSYRNHREFHEHCAERIFTDLENHADLEFLDVRACYTRRGGIDINPRRCSRDIPPESIRLERQ